MPETGRTGFAGQVLCSPEVNFELFSPRTRHSVHGSGVQADHLRTQHQMPLAKAPPCRLLGGILDFKKSHSLGWRDGSVSKAFGV